jgi:hypothetical protein|tara:strand:+ start:393 stop:740 length:348 start_codon:yes stop_codon:yes gene_type:complete
MSAKFLLACFLILCGHVVAWYGTYAQFIWTWCKNNVALLPLIFSIPTGYLFLYGMRFAVEEMNEVWGPRLLGFGLSYLVFPFLTYYYFNESMFEPKTMICVTLSVLIVAIQVLWN